MKFSVIIPVYNVEAYLIECLNSVLDQTFEDWEAICVNDGSTDNSVAILAEYGHKDSRFKIFSQSNGGLSAARNTGLKTATGEYVLFLDSDDWLEGDALEKVSESLTDEDLLCFSGRRYFEKEGKHHEADQLKACTYTTGMDYYNENALQPRDFAFECVVLRAYKRSFLMDNHLWFKVGIFHEDDLYTPMACFYAKKVRQVTACLYNYRVRANSITTTSNVKRLRDYLEIANSLATFFLSKQGFDKTMVYRVITHHYQVVFKNAPKAERKRLYQLCNWRLYRIVSRTKLRHRWNYLKNRFWL